MREHGARAMWAIFEPIHAVTYFSPVARAAFEEAGLRGFWRGYFAGRAAPFGPAPAAPVTAAFFSFAPHMVVRALPDVWQRASPERALAARLRGAVNALTPLATMLEARDLAEAVELIEAAVAELDTAGRVLGAANAALPRPQTPLGRLWQATTTLREHRGDGHIAALVTAGVGGCEALVLRAGHDLARDVLQPVRGWSDDDWAAAAARLVSRGWLDAAGRATRSGISEYERIEADTDALGAVPWNVLGPDRTARLTMLLTPLAKACRAELPVNNPIGLPGTSG